MSSYHHDIKLGTLNHRTLKCELSLHKTAAQVQKLSLAALAIQEHHLIGSGKIDLGENMSIEGWGFSYNGFASSYGGVGLLYNSAKITIIDEQDPLKGRMQLSKLTIQGLKVLWPVIYSPTDAQADSSKLKFYHVEKFTAKAKNDEPSFKLLFSGDFNATIGRDSNDMHACIHLNNDPWPTNTNGRHLLQMAENLQLQILNTKFRCKNIHRMTYVTPGNRLRKGLDNVLSQKFVSDMATNCRVYRGLHGDNREFNADYRLLVLPLKVPIKADLKTNKKETKKPPRARPNISLLGNDPQAAYDWVPRLCLLNVFEFRTGASKITKMLAESFTGTKAQLTGSKEKFPTICGLKQGALESPVLFNIYFDICIQVAKEKIRREIQPGIVSLKFDIKSECLRPRGQRSRWDSSGKITVEEEEYDDDFIGVNTSIDESKAALEAMDKTFKRFGLTISFGKTETMLFGFPEAETAKKIKLANAKLQEIKRCCAIGKSTSEFEPVICRLLSAPGCFTRPSAGTSKKPKSRDSKATDMRKQILFAQGYKHGRSIWKRFEALLFIDEIQIRKQMTEKSKVPLPVHRQLEIW
eukprot:gene17859-19639_t